MDKEKNTLSNLNKSKKASTNLDTEPRMDEEKCDFSL